MQTQGAGQVGFEVAGGVDIGYQLRDGFLFTVGAMFQLDPERLFQRDAGAVSGDSDRAFLHAFIL